jgi:hypothetical protein
MRPLDPLGKPYSIRLYRISTSGSCATAFSHAHLAEGDNYQIPNGQGVGGKKKSLAGVNQVGYGGFSITATTYNFPNEYAPIDYKTECVPPT